MEFKDYYNIMGVARDASQDEIKRAYRRLARKYHPVVSKETEAETRIKEVGEACEALKDPEKRAAYDPLGANWRAGQEFRPLPGWDAGFEFRGANTDNFGADAVGGFFESLFGRYFRAGDTNRKIRGIMSGAKQTIILRSPELDSEGRVSFPERNLNAQIPKGVTQRQRVRPAGQGGKGPGNGKPGDLYLEIESEQIHFTRSSNCR